MVAITTLPAINEVAQKAAATAVAELNKAIGAHGTATWVLAGGTSPMAAYKIVAKEHSNAVDWQKVYVLMGDERCVSSDHPDFNWRQVDDVLLRHITIPATNQLQPPGGIAPDDAAMQYQTMLLTALPKNKNGTPRLDHVWLGIGEDGHTLSLFPGREATWGNDRIVIAIHNSPKPPPGRISLTLGALAGASTCVIFMVGEGKKTVVSRAKEDDTSLPFVQATHIIESAGGHVTWLLDQDAAGL